MHSRPPAAPTAPRLAHYLADKKKSEKAVLEMAGKVTQQLQVAAAARRTDEGLKVGGRGGWAGLRVGDGLGVELG